MALKCAREAGSVEAEANALGGLGDAHYLSGRMRSRTSIQALHRAGHQQAWADRGGE